MSFQHYTRSFKIGSAIRSQNNEPIEIDHLRKVVPSIFATEAHSSRSDRFAPVPTIDVLAGLQREGFEVFHAVQARTRDAGRAEFTKHMLRLRHRGIENGAGQAFEIVLVNANDGTSAYQMIPGFFRMVCANGMICGDTFGEVKVRHSGRAIDDVVEGAYRVLDDAPRVTDQVSRFRSINLNEGERLALATAAHELRFEAREGSQVPIAADRLLHTRRTEDRQSDLWTAFNVVQENVIRGGLTGFVRDGNNRQRRATTREVGGIDQSRALNRALWTLTERMAELKSAA